jgi:hypothetical protein
LTAQGFRTNLPFGKYDKAAFFLEYHVAGVHASVGWLLERGTDTRPPRLSGMSLSIHSHGSQFSFKKAKELPIEPPVLYW